MEDLARADEDQFVSAMTQRAMERVREMIRAVNSARTGHLIDDSEGPVLQSLRELGRELYEAALQARVDATEAAACFSPSGAIGRRDGRSVASQSLGTDAIGACSMDPSAVLEPPVGGGGAGRCVGGPRRGDGKRRGA